MSRSKPSLVQPSSLSGLTRQIMVQRGYVSNEAQLEFLNPDYARTDYDPFLLPDMARAVERLSVARARHERVIIYGDYDVDGVTATTLLLKALPLFGLDVGYFVPDRFRDGYGMNQRAIKQLKDEGANLIVTVDNGIVANSVADYAKKIGLDLVITDHHEPRANLPHACAVVDPKILARDHPLAYDRHFCMVGQAASGYPFLDLCGCGVAFKLVRAMQQKFPDDLPQGQEKWLLDLVALATICDMVSLVDENRALARWGMVVLRQTRRPGLRALIAAAGIKPTQINSETVGFTLGPRLNAAGRLANANLAVELLSTDNSERATELALQLNALNDKRKSLQKQIAREALDQRDPTMAVNVVAREGWHQGVIGIAASQVERASRKPSFVGSVDSERGVVKLSGRSFGDFSIARAITKTNDLLLAGGGHAAAGGVTVALDKLQQWAKALNDYYRSLELDATTQLKYLFSQPDLVLEKLDQLNADFVRELGLLEPFGTANPSVTVRLKNFLVSRRRLMGKEQNHLALSVADAAGNELRTVAFNASPEALSFMPGDRATILLSPTINSWRGNESVEGIIERIT